jgi:hypothetical protein
MPRGRKKSADAANGSIPSKTDVVKQALAELGSTAKPKELQRYISENFKLDLSTNLISNYKSTFKKDRGRKKGGRGKGGRPAATASKPMASGISLEDIRAVKQLADRIGADKVRELASVLGR